MKSKDVVMGMKVVPKTKSVGRQPFQVIVELMKEYHTEFLYVHGWNIHERCWELRAPNSPVLIWYFKAKEFEPYKEDE